MDPATTYWQASQVDDRRVEQREKGPTASDKGRVGKQAAGPADP